MKTSELITLLQEAITQHGDLDSYYCDYEEGNIECTGVTITHEIMWLPESDTNHKIIVID